MASREAFLRSAWEEIRALQGRSRLAILLPRDTRKELAFSEEDCPMQYMSGQLCNFEDVVASPDCSCDICSGRVPGDALKLPAGCRATSKRLLMKVVSELSESFEPQRYSAGDIARLVVARHAEALLHRAQRRNNARAVVRVAQVCMHRIAAGKRTTRIEAVRASMGDDAFTHMVQTQLDERRNKAMSGLNANDAQWLQTSRWWQSDEGRQYWSGPPCPPSSLVADVLVRNRSIGLLRASREGLVAPLVYSGRDSPGDVVVAVPPRSVARVAAALLDWNLSRQTFGHRCRCSASATVRFDAQSGERVPRVHIAGGSASDLALLDAASLENLHSGDVLIGARRFVSVRGRVVAVTGREPVALALPRPHDQFDTVLRGPTPPTSKLPVGWDITDTAVQVNVRVSWSATPLSELSFVVVASEEAAALTDAQIDARLEELLSPTHQVSERRLKALKNVLFWAPRFVWRIFGFLDRWALRFVMEVVRLGAKGLEPCWDLAKRCGEVVYERVLLPALSSTGRCLRSFDAAMRPALRAVVDASRRCTEGFRQMSEPALRAFDDFSGGCAARWRSGVGAAWRTFAEACGTFGQRVLQAGSAVATHIRPLREGIDRMCHRLAAPVAQACDWIAEQAVVAVDAIARAWGYAWRPESGLGRSWLALRASLGSAWFALGQAAAAVAKWMGWQQEPVRLARVRRHDERHAMAR